MFLRSVQFSITEAKQAGRGAMKLATCAEEGLLAIGWVNGNPVHFLTTADGTDETHTQRQVGNRRRKQRAYVAIKPYNHGMRAVDRFDFSVLDVKETCL